MSSKSEVLRRLEQAKGESISGEDLAKSAGISRTAVWKIIQGLKEEGYAISAVTNKGYCLAPNTDRLSAEGIELYLPESTAGKIHVYKSVDSTNTVAKQMALEGAAHGTAVLAETQTAGKGRLGRRFFSPEQSGVYLSMVLRPKLTAQEALLITTAASVAVCRAIQIVTGQSPQIKWVNDVYLGDRKVCGILTEAVSNFENGEIESIVLGIGINFHWKEPLPNELQQKAGALFEGEVPLGITRNQLAAELIRQVEILTEQIPSRAFLQEYRERSLVLGKRIEIHNFHQEPYFAIAEGIHENGGLIVRLEDGSLQTIQSGEVSIRGIFCHE